MSLSAGVHILEPSTPRDASVLKGIVYIHAACVLYDHTMATFIPPLSYEWMYKRWESFLGEVGVNERVIIVSISTVSSRHLPDAEPGLRPPFGSEWPVLPDSNLEVSGVISLSMPASETGPFRGLVQNLFVHPYHRRKGIATTLLSKLEEQAVANDRWSLMLDTTVGTLAVGMYEKLNWNKLGVVKAYGLSPKDGSLLDEVWFWKDIRDRQAEDDGR